MGETIQFGIYEQDGDSSNGSEPIEWDVLATDEDGFYSICDMNGDKQ